MIFNLEVMVILLIFTATISHLKFSAVVADLIDIGQRASIVLRPWLRWQTKLLDLLKLHLPVKGGTKSNTLSGAIHPGNAVVMCEEHKTSGWLLMQIGNFCTHYCHYFLYKINTTYIYNLSFWVFFVFPHKSQYDLMWTSFSCFASWNAG